MYECWCHNPVATLALCLLAQAYDLAASLITHFALVDVTVGFLMQADKLVQLLESHFSSAPSATFGGECWVSPAVAKKFVRAIDVTSTICCIFNTQ